MNTVQLAGKLPNDVLFREWVRLHTVPPLQSVTKDEAAEFIRCVCGIETRKMLATDQAAALRFHTLLRKPYVAWLRRVRDGG